MQFVLEQSGAAGLFCADAYRGFDMQGMAEAIRPSLPGLREVVSLATWDEFLASADPGRALPQVAPGDMIQVQYTSGTTGFPRGAMLHHTGLVNEATFVAERAGMGDGGVCVNAMPMYHIGGGAVTSFGTWAKRGTFVILPGFEPGLLLEAFEAYAGTHTLVVPTMLIAMLDHPDLARRDLSSLQTIMSGAASVPASLVRKTIGLLGCQFSILFGQTETHGVISQTRVAAVLLLRADFARPTAAELTEFLRDQIAPHKIPVFWSFVDRLPMTPTGKTQKYVLRQQAADGTLTFDKVWPRSLSQT